jgi:Trypsin
MCKLTELAFFPHITHKTYTPTKDTCQGDSGGPLLDANGRQVGITSFSRGKRKFRCRLAFFSLQVSITLPLFRKRLRTKRYTSGQHSSWGLHTVDTRRNLRPFGVQSRFLYFTYTCTDRPRQDPTVGSCSHTGITCPVSHKIDNFLAHQVSG